ncbi:aspartyl/lysyl-trna synthetase [Holotrichia oblita]|nr:aspartyl/lysyl-trna synthetase [Holotrichia oblita]
MAESMAGMKRTHYCGEVSVNDIDCEITLGGFTQRVRDKGSLIFIDLRDRTGLIQLVFDETTERGIFEKAKTIKSEYVLMVRGVLWKRENINKDIATGSVEVLVSELRILSKAQTLPFEIQNETKVNDELRLKYRYLDLRRKKLQDNLTMRHNIAKAAREYFYANKFIEIETPMFIKSTPEGARDYLVPSRIHAGKFYALPQSPQIYKQLLMVSGFDRYIQLARCFRDEDLRADRQPEFTQIDVEMSFVDVDDILEMIEGFVKHVMSDVLGVNIETPLPRLTYNEAMSRFGSDKPDTRYGMEITDISDCVKNSDFPVFSDVIKNKGSVRGIVASGASSILTRKEIDKLTEFVRGIGAKGLAYIRWTEDSELPNCSFSKFFDENNLLELCRVLGCKKGDTALIVADKNKVTLPVLGALRGKLAKQLGIIPDSYNYLWVTEMPFFEWNEETESFDAMHHPFTMPMDDCMEFLDTAPEKVYAKAYDLVLNGTELCSGSIRITDHELQERMFRALGLTKEEIEAKFGFLVDAYKYASPPHGGVGIGLDRLAMVLCGAESLRDITAFPKIKDASDLMSDCPAVVDEKQLNELHIKTIPLK